DISLPLLMILISSLNAPSTAGIYTLSLHDALPISWAPLMQRAAAIVGDGMSNAVSGAVPLVDMLPQTQTEIVQIMREMGLDAERSEEHTSELQSRFDLVCRLLLEKKKQDTE